MDGCRPAGLPLPELGSVRHKSWSCAGGDHVGSGGGRSNPTRGCCGGEAGLPEGELGEEKGRWLLGVPPALGRELCCPAAGPSSPRGGPLCRGLCFPRGYRWFMASVPSQSQLQPSPAYEDSLPCSPLACGKPVLRLPSCLGPLAGIHTLAGVGLFLGSVQCRGSFCLVLSQRRTVSMISAR